MGNKAVSENKGKLKKLHPLWMLFELVKSIKGFIFFFIFLSFVLGLSSTSIFSKYGIIFIVVFTVYQLGSILLEWKHFGYSIDKEELFIKKGRLVTLNRHFPLENIQGLNQNTSFFQRFFGLTSLLIDAGSSDKDASIKLEMINFQEANYIKKLLSEFGEVNIINDDNVSDVFNKESEINSQESGSTRRKKHYEINLKEILIASLTSLRLLFFLALVYSLYSEISQFFSVDKYVENIMTFLQSSWLTLTLGIIVLVCLSIIYGALKTYIQYGGFTVTSDSYRIYIEKGILGVANFSIPKDRIQALSINSSFIHKLLNIANVKLISSADTEDEDIKATSILFPFIHKNTAKILIPQILPKYEIKDTMINIPKSSIFVKLLRTIYIWLLFPVMILYFYPTFWYIAILVFSFTLLSQILSGLFSSYAFNGTFIQLRKGSISTKTFITNRDNIERLVVTETAIQRKMGISSMKIISRARPTKVTTIHDIPKDVSLKYYIWYLEGIERSKTPKSS